MAVWKTISKFVDLDTGEPLSRLNATTYYYTIRIKKIIYGHPTKRGYVIRELIHECRQKPKQLSIIYK